MCMSCFHEWAFQTSWVIRLDSPLISILFASCENDVFDFPIDLKIIMLNTFLLWMCVSCECMHASTVYLMYGVVHLHLDAQTLW